MTQELEVASCGLDSSNAQLHMNDTKNFSPEKYKVNTADFICEYANCELSNGVEIKFSTITGATTTEVEKIFESEVKDPNSRISEKLRQARLENCPFYKQQFWLK